MTLKSGRLSGKRLQFISYNQHPALAFRRGFFISGNGFMRKNKIILLPVNCLLTAYIAET
jgi:hypothetical protein